MRRVHVALAGLVFLAILAQFYLAALGAFDQPRDDGSFALHRMVGMSIPLLSLLATGAAALARAPGRLIGMTILPAALTIVQTLIRVVADGLGNPDDTSTTLGVVVFGLHGVNALVTMGAAGAALRGARARLSAPAPASRESGASSPAS